MPEPTALMKPLLLTYGFYRQPNGWITVSPATDIEELKYRREGWEPLPQYGRVEMVSEYAVDHPLEWLFVQGGAKELPVDQVIEMALHLTPPLMPTCGRRLDQDHKRHLATCWEGAQPVSFPQLDGEYLSFQCRFCTRDPFSTEEAREQHEGVMHKEEKSDIRTGETLADSLTRGLRDADAVKVSPSTPATEPYVCGFCGEGFSNHIQLSRHVKKEHKEGNGGNETGLEGGGDDSEPITAQDA